jgi:hypothetical protein
MEEAHFKSRRKLPGGVVGWRSGTMWDGVVEVLHKVIVSPNMSTSAGNTGR